VNEIKDFQDVHWISALEAFWKIYRFFMTETHPSVRLQVHFPNQQLVHSKANESLLSVSCKGGSARSMLLTFFEKNSINFHARQHLYKDFQEHFT
jgi:hypothetical protein